MALTDDFLERMKKIERRLEALESYPQASAVSVSNLGTVTPISIPNGASAILAFTVTNINGLRLLPVPFVSIYRGSSATAAARYPTGSDWAGLLGSVRREDWLEKDATDGNNGVSYTHIFNNTGGAITVYAESIWRVGQANGGTS